MSFRSIGDQEIDVALGALRRGRAIVLSHGGTALAFLPVEFATRESMEAFDPEGRAGLLVTPERLAVLGRSAADLGTDAVVARVAPALTLEAARTIANPLLDGTMPPPPMTSEIPAEPTIASAAIRLVKMAELLPALLFREAKPGEGPVGAAERVWSYSEPKQARVAVSARLPVDVDDNAHITTFSGSSGANRHVALIIGNPDMGGAPLVRLHSECLTGDVFGSRRCDCGEQLRLAKTRMRDEGGGILLYLRQEGRDIGLTNKMRTYALQHRGHDTVDANFHLGFGADERDFRTAAGLLTALGVTRARLLTNNPLKMQALKDEGIAVECIPLKTDPHSDNAHYLATKRDRSGHLL